MLAKVISFGETRVEAANKLALALENSHFGGMKTNRDYLVSILRSKEYLEGDTTTDFVERVNLNSEIDLTEEEIFNFAKVGAMWIQGKNRSERMFYKIFNLVGTMPDSPTKKSNYRLKIKNTG